MARGFNGARLRELRENAGLTQTDLAKKVRVKSSNVSRWEAGGQSPRPRKIKALSVVLKVKIEELLVVEEPVLETK